MVPVSASHSESESAQLHGPVRELSAFRSRLYGCFGRRADALFEICDAILTAGSVPSPVHLSLATDHRRSWGSLYAALSKGRISAEELRDVLACHPLESHGDKGAPPVYAVDVTSWPRCEAESSPERGYYYHPSRHSVGQPIVAGWAYQFVARIGFARDSWVAPVDARRLRPEEDPNDAAAEQVETLVRRLPESGIFPPLFVFDAGYDPVRLQRSLEGCRAQILVRLHSGRVFYPDPPNSERRPVGRPFRHGEKFDCKDPSTWPEPGHEHLCETADYGEVRVRAWSGLHPKTRRAAERYGATSARVVEGTVVLVEVERLPRGERRRKPKGLWWHGPNEASSEAEPDLDLLWRSYCRRFDVEHVVRFLKQRLGWTMPRVRHPEQADRWGHATTTPAVLLCLKAS